MNKIIQGHTLSVLDGYYHFTLDPCATPQNAKCPKYYTKEDDGLIMDWSDETVFMNPPYGRQIGRWIKKAHDEAQRGAVVVCLIPARTDTAWWHEYCLHGDITFLRGRLYFRNGKGAADRAPFPSTIVVFTKHECIDLKRLKYFWEK